MSVSVITSPGAGRLSQGVAVQTSLWGASSCTPDGSGLCRSLHWPQHWFLPLSDLGALGL